MNNNDDIKKTTMRSGSTLMQPIKKNLVTDPQKNMLSTNKLNAMLHKLKKHYNDMNSVRKAKDLQVEILEKKKFDLQSQIKCKENFGDIDFPSEKISIQDYEKLKETKEEIQEKIQKLIYDKNQLLLKYQSELEYGNTLNNLISIEKKNYENLNEHLLKTEEKINTVKSAKRNLELNAQEFGKRQKIFSNFKKTQELECHRLDDVIAFQDNNNLNISEDLKSKIEENNNLEKELINLKTTFENGYKKNKERIMEDIKKNQKIKVEKLIEQNKLIKLVLGLDLIKIYFIDLDKKNIEINNANLLKSEDYKLFQAKEYIVIDEENNVLNNISTNQGINGNLSEENNKDKNDYENLNTNTINDNLYNGNVNNSGKRISNNSQNINLNRSNNKNNNMNSHNYNHNSNNSNTNFNNSENVTNKISFKKEKYKIYLKDIKEKLDNLDMDFNTMNNFYTKIINKTNFFHNHMINFNLKQISLESKKDQYTKRVKEIIEKNSKNIEDLIKFNPKFKNLLNILNIDIKNDNFVKIVKEKIGNISFISKVSLNKYEVFYKKCQKYFSDLKTFNQFIMHNYERIIEEIPPLEDNLRENLKGKFLIVKKNYEIEYEGSSDSDKIEYLFKLFGEIEIEYIKENSKLEKIEIVISNIKLSNEDKEKENMMKNKLFNGEIKVAKSEPYKGFPFIDPYSKWPIEKLEKEKNITYTRIKILKKFIDLKLFFEDENNRKHVFALDIPLEKILYSFLNGINNYVENVKITKSVIDIFNNYNINSSNVSMNYTDKSSIDNAASFDGKCLKYVIL